MSFWWILILGVIFALGWLLVRSGRSNGSGGGESAEQALKMRYAKGEIDRTAYEEMLRALRH